MFTATAFLAIVPLLSVLVAVGGLIIALRQWRESALRRADVLAWANETIYELQSLLLVCILDEDQLDATAKRAKLTEIVFNTTALVERGRLFFKNEVRDDHGQDKELAYRGYRPTILDQIVLAHQIAKRWEKADANVRSCMRLLAEDCAKKFVSLAQQEVGRSKTASAVTKKGGDGRPLDDLLKDFDKTRAEEGPTAACTRLRAAAEASPVS